MRKKVTSSDNAASKVTIRDGTFDDLEAIAYIRVVTWRTTYAGIVPDDHLAALDHEQKAATLKQFFDEFPGFYTVAEKNSQVIGYAIAGAERTTLLPFSGELWAMYILQEYQRQGIGHLLVETVANRLAAQQHASMIVWVLADNPCRRFYESLGGVLSGEKTLVIGGKTLTEVAYGWPDTTSLRNCAGCQIS